MHLRVFCFLVGMLLTTLSAGAQDAIWLSNPGSNDINVGSNWSTGTVPTGTASFGVSNTTTLFSSGFGQTFGGWTFTAGASAYTISLTPGSGNVGTQFVGAGVEIDGGSVSIANSGAFNALNFANRSTAGGAQIINSGSMQFLNSSSAGAATITNNRSLQYSGSSTADHATMVNNGGLSFGDNSTAGNSIIVNNSLSGQFGFCFGCTPYPGLGFSGTSTAGNATITTDRGLTQFFGQSTGGNGRFILVWGTVDFSGTTGPNGDRKLSAGSLEGTGNYSLGSNELTVGSNTLATQVAGSLLDGGQCLSPCLGGSLVKIGTGTLTLSGINTYSGATTINGGAIIVDGTIASSSLTIVNTGGTLAGSGTVGNSAISGGTLAPGSPAGNRFGPLTMQGNLSFTTASTYMIQVSPTNAARTNATGTASLGGATVDAVFASGGYVQKQYTILTANGGVSGTFGALTGTNVPANLHPTLSYDANDVFLNLVFIIPGLNGNQQAVGNALTNFFISTGSIPTVFTTLSSGALSQASGEIATGSQQTTIDAMTQFMGVMTDPFIAGRGDSFGASGSGPTGYTSTQKTSAARDANAVFVKAPLLPFEQRWSTWVAAYGGSQTTDGNAALGSNSATSRIYGTAVGADYRISPYTLAGFSLAGGSTSFSVANSGTGHSDLFQAGAFVRHTVGSAYISAALAYGWQHITTDRTVTIATLDQLQARFDANAWSGRIEGGYRFVTPVMGGIGIAPYAAAQFTTFDMPAYAESAISGASTFALGHGARGVTDSRSELGIRTDKSFAMPDAVLTLRGRYAWAHDFDPDRSIGATFQTLPGASFVVGGAAQALDSALTTASAELKWTNNWSVAAAFEGEVSSVTRSYAGKGVVRYAW